MNTLFVGMALFFGVHVLTSTPLRAVMVGAIGERPYKAVFSILSLIGFGLMIWGFGMSRSGPDSARIVFNPPEWGLPVTTGFVLLGMIALASQGGKSHIRKIIRQSMSVGIALWAIGHLFSNGNLNEVALFGGFLAYSIFDIIVSTAKGKSPDFQAQFKSDLIAIVIGVAIFSIILFFHFNLFGVAVI